MYEFSIPNDPHRPKRKASDGLVQCLLYTQRQRADTRQREVSTGDGEVC